MNSGALYCSFVQILMSVLYTTITAAMVTDVRICLVHLGRIVLFRFLGRTSYILRIDVFEREIVVLVTKSIQLHKHALVNMKVSFL